MPFVESLNVVFRKYPAYLYGAVVTAGAVVAAFVIWQGVQIDRMARATETTLTSHMEAERTNQQQLMGAIGAIDDKMDGLAQDVSHVKGRLGLPRSASGPDSVVYTTPETP